MEGLAVYERYTRLWRLVAVKRRDYSLAECLRLLQREQREWERVRAAQRMVGK